VLRIRAEEVKGVTQNGENNTGKRASCLMPLDAASVQFTLLRLMPMAAGCYAMQIQRQLDVSSRRVVKR